MKRMVLQQHKAALMTFTTPTPLLYAAFYCVIPSGKHCTTVLTVRSYSKDIALFASLVMRAPLAPASAAS